MHVELTSSSRIRMWGTLLDTSNPANNDDADNEEDAADEEGEQKCC